jgi:hypothetical protein
MTNLLYWLLIITSFCAGFRGYPVWTILLLGMAAAAAYFIDRPRAFEIGMRERGVVYPLMMVAASSLPAGILFLVGWLAGRAVSQILN